MVKWWPFHYLILHDNELLNYFSIEIYNNDNDATCVVRSDEDVAKNPDWTHWWGDVHSHEAFGDCDDDNTNMLNNDIIAYRIVWAVIMTIIVFVIIVLFIRIIGTWEADCFAKLGDFHCVPGRDDGDEEKHDDDDDEKEYVGNYGYDDDDDADADDDDDDDDDTGLVWEGSQHRRCWSWCWAGWGGRVIMIIVTLIIIIVMTTIIIVNMILLGRLGICVNNDSCHHHLKDCHHYNCMPG